MEIDWNTLTIDRAKLLLGPANRAEALAAARFEISGSAEDETKMLAAYQLWEDLRVYVACGVKPLTDV